MEGCGERWQRPALQAQLTDYHAKYFAYELTKRWASDSVEKLAAVLADAQEKQAVAPFPKVLLTATPLQNTLLELYGLVTIIA